MTWTTCVRELPGFIWCVEQRPCWHCGEATSWVDLAFEVSLHPGRCSEAKQDDYAWAEMFAVLRERGLS